MPRLRLCAGALTAALLGAVGFAAAAASPDVVASIKPIHSLAAAVMEGVGEPALLVRGSASPHGYSLRPSDAKRLEEAEVVFWVGPFLEGFLVRPLAALADDAAILEIARIPELDLLPLREGGIWEPHNHADPDGPPASGPAERHGRAGPDPHLWLDPDNARAIVAAMAEVLSEADPGNAATYRANAASAAARIDELDAELGATLAPVRDRPFVVFHDAYQYFEAHYGLAAAAAIMASPDQVPGARRLREVRKALHEAGVVCVFREPGFAPALVDTLTEGTDIRQGELDPEGAMLQEGPGLYFQLMRNMAHSIADCLGGPE